MLKWFKKKKNKEPVEVTAFKQQFGEDTFYKTKEYIRRIKDREVSNRLGKDFRHFKKDIESLQEFLDNDRFRAQNARKINKEDLKKELAYHIRSFNYLIDRYDIELVAPSSDLTDTLGRPTEKPLEKEEKEPFFKRAYKKLKKYYIRFENFIKRKYLRSKRKLKKWVKTNKDK